MRRVDRAETEREREREIIRTDISHSQARDKWTNQRTNTGIIIVIINQLEAKTAGIKWKQRLLTCHDISTCSALPRP